MSRFRPGHGSAFRIQDLGGDIYHISWTCDRYINGSRLRFPTRYTRTTDGIGAARFAKRHGVKFPGASHPQHAAPGDNSQACCTSTEEKRC